MITLSFIVSLEDPSNLHLWVFSHSFSKEESVSLFPRSYNKSHGQCSGNSVKIKKFRHQYKDFHLISIFSLAPNSTHICACFPLASVTQFL